MRLGRTWMLGLFALTVLLCAAAVPQARRMTLGALGRVLVEQDPLRRADAVIVSVDADGAGVLEAADLIHQDIAARVAVFEDPPDATDREFLRRGVPYHDAASISIAQLRALGIPAVEVIPRTVAGTTDEGDALRTWCLSRHLRTVIFVATRDHSRRTRRILRRAFRGAACRVIVRYSPYSLFDPDSWWKTRGGARIELVELEKLLLDEVRHPLT